MLSNDVYKDTVNFSSGYLPWLIQCPCHRWYFSKRTVSSYFPICLELPWSLGSLGFLYRPPRLWPLSTPMSLEVPWDPGALRFLVSLCGLCLYVVLWILANRESPQCLLAPRVQGFPAYLESLARKSRHHNHKVRMLETAECPTCSEKRTLWFYPDPMIPIPLQWLLSDLIHQTFL